MLDQTVPRLRRHVEPVDHERNVRDTAVGDEHVCKQTVFPEEFPVVSSHNHDRVLEALPGGRDDPFGDRVDVAQHRVVQHLDGGPLGLLEREPTCNVAVRVHRHLDGDLECLLKGEFEVGSERVLPGQRRVVRVVAVPEVDVEEERVGTAGPAVDVAGGQRLVEISQAAFRRVPGEPRRVAPEIQQEPCHGR